MKLPKELAIGNKVKIHGTFHVPEDFQYELLSYSRNFFFIGESVCSHCIDCLFIQVRSWKTKFSQFVNIYLWRHAFADTSLILLWFALLSKQKFDNWNLFKHYIRLAIILNSLNTHIFACNNFSIKPIPNNAE